MHHYHAVSRVMLGVMGEGVWDSTTPKSSQWLNGIRNRHQHCCKPQLGFVAVLDALSVWSEHFLSGFGRPDLISDIWQNEEELTLLAINVEQDWPGSGNEDLITTQPG